MNRRTRNTQGFTLIELMLAMTFVAVLLLTIALTVIQIATIYNRGMTLKEVNQAARDVADDLRRGVQGSGVFPINQDGTDTESYVTIKNTDGVVIGGRLCMGSTSYIWNTATGIETINGDSADENLTWFTTNTSGAKGDAVNLVKVPDASKRYCTKDAANKVTNQNILFTDNAVAKELLKPGERTIRMLDFAVTSRNGVYDTASQQRLYTVSYRLGTGATSAMNSDQTACLPPNEPNSNLTYCNVQQFSIVLRAGNTVN